MLFERVEELVGALCRRDPSIANVLARLSFPALPGFGPEPGLIGVHELLWSQHDPGILDSHLKDVAWIDVREATD